MPNLASKIHALLERIQAGEGPLVMAELAETLELWLTSGLIPVPEPLQPHVERLGVLLGELARQARPAPADMPSPTARWTPAADDKAAADKAAADDKAADDKAADDKAAADK
ncbi:MAG: hypothetical protein AB8I08_32335, partial [Sandaracinaceae bacterium]